MADNIVLNSGSGGSTLATDDVGGIQYQLIKLAYGALDTATLVTGTVGLPVAVLAGTANIGDIDVLTVPAPLSTTGSGTEATALRVTVATDSTGVLSVDDNGGALTVDSAQLPSALVSSRLDVNVGATGSGVSIEAVGDVAHDAAAAGNPVLIAARANLNEPAAVSTDADSTYLWADLLGRLVVLVGHSNPEAPVTANGSAAGLSVVAAPGANLSLYINKVTITNRAAAENVVSLRDGAAGTVRTTINCAADGGGANLDYGSRGWKLTANTALVADIGSASADVNVTEYYIAA